MEEKEFLDLVGGLEKKLFSRELNKWVGKQSEEQKIEFRKLRSKVSTCRSQLENGRLKILSGKLEELAPELINGVADLQKSIGEMKDFDAAVQVLGRVLGIILQSSVCAA